MCAPPPLNGPPLNGPVVFFFSSRAFDAASWRSSTLFWTDSDDVLLLLRCMVAVVVLSVPECPLSSAYTNVMALPYSLTALTICILDMTNPNDTVT